ncbi:GNAT family N-acetyltransferase [Eisenbergiella tayi]
MNLTYRKAAFDDIDILTKTRTQVLRAANELEEDADMSAVEKETYDYYLTALKDGSHSAFLVFDRGIFVGAGGISFYRVMPTFHNTTGKKAYIMNMYTHPDYRRRGIACHVLQLLTEEAKEKGVSHITLEATKAGRYLYEKFGFVRMEDEMILPQE